ncbi:hypothetical protein MTR67_023745 [Solanum verrucosum]|uniref:Uncharacterized protein n=1 Tax=Solanum verrucosum TaxID=315347 RepID=A0AAF0R0F1_SOLVR|nr:hypothetical protein MTR67_023745 [Solanum verrucosum]
MQLGYFCKRKAYWNLVDCGGFRHVTPTIFQFLDNRSRIMLAAGANPIFAHTSLVVWELNQKPGEILSFPYSP